MPSELGEDHNQFWYFVDYNKFKPVFLFCPWTTEIPTEQVEVKIARIDFTLHQQIRLRLQFHPAGKPLISKFETLTRYHKHFVSAIAPIQNYHDFPERGFLESVLTFIALLLTEPVVDQYT